MNTSWFLLYNLDRIYYSMWAEHAEDFVSSIANVASGELVVIIIQLGRIR